MSDGIFGGEGGTRTLAPVLSQPTPLAGAPRHHLSTSPNVTSRLILSCLFKVFGGEDGIRTHGSFESLVFKTSSLNRSDTSPRLNYNIS